MGKKVKWTNEHLDFIKANQADISRRELFELLCNTFDDIDPIATLDNFKGLVLRMGLRSNRDGCFKKGQIPWNKGVKGYMGANRTSFKKGQPSHNQRPIGSQRICSKDKYVIEKVAEPDVWKHKHRLLWEEHYGEIPEDCVIRFIDKDRMNITIENLICVPQGANSVLNLHNRPDTQDPDLNKAIILTETLRHEIRKLHG